MGEDDLKITQEPWLRALRETDSHLLKLRIAEAETAIFSRQQALPRSPESQAERQALDDGLTRLRILRRDLSSTDQKEKCFGG
jgi:hypothetical protein